MPVAVVITDAFEHEAQVQRAALGMDALAPVVIAHPLSTLTGPELEARVEQALPRVRAAWLGRA